MSDEISMHGMHSTQRITGTDPTDAQGHILHGSTEAPRKSLERTQTNDTIEAGKPAAQVVPRSMAFKKIFGAAVMLLVLFWANSSWIFGKIVSYHSNATVE